MKSRLFKIVIAAEFDQEYDHAIVADAVMQALQTEGIPRGRAQVMAVPIQVEPVQRLPKEVLDRLN